MSTDEPRRLVTLQTAAYVWDISYSELYAAVRSGEIRNAVQKGRRWRVQPDEVDAWMRRDQDDDGNS